MIRVGVGGWTFPAWRGLFFPAGLRHADELPHMAARLRTIEVNGTFYRTQTPETFANWAAQAPEGFVFTLKAPRYAVMKKALAEAGDSVARFVQSGIDRLGPKLGPVLWQFAPTRRFDADDIAAFLALLPTQVNGLPLRHALEPRHPSFAAPEFVALARDHNAAIVYADHAEYVAIADATADFAYLRLQRGHDDEPACYPPASLDRWARTLTAIAAGEPTPDLPHAAEPAPPAPRDVFAFLIHDGKMRAPHGAEALQARVDAPPPKAPATR